MASRPRLTTGLPFRGKLSRVKPLSTSEWGQARRQPVGNDTNENKRDDWVRRHWRGGQGDL
jgi:hypothetical protein